MDTKAPQIRELFIEELEQVHGGGPVEDLIRELQEGGGGNTTMACCEEGNNCGGGCTAEPW